MANTKTNIPYVDTTWNPVIGCSRESAGCQNCYAEAVAARLARNPKTQHLYAQVVNPDSGRWTGRVVTNPGAMDLPYRWKKGRRVLVDSMTDIFHPNVHLATLQKVWWAMVENPHHLFFTLTKRADRMEETVPIIMKALDLKKPPENLRLGVTVEGVDQLDRILALRLTPAAVRWISFEPLLEDLGDVSAFLKSYRADCDTRPGIDWAVIGCESGPNRRHCSLDWIHGVAYSCRKAGVPYYVKQVMDPWTERAISEPYDFPDQGPERNAALRRRDYADADRFPCYNEPGELF